MITARQGWKHIAFALALAASVPALTNTAEQRARDAGPEDGGVGNSLVSFLFDGTRVLVTTGRAGIFRSENRGALWHRSMEGLVAPNGVAPQVVSLCQSPSAPRIVYALAGLEQDVTPFNGLFSSDDFGSTWTRRASVSTGFGFGVCTVDPDDPRTLYVSRIADNPWKSGDGGQTVQRIDVDIPSFLGATVLPVHGVTYVAGFDAVYASTDGGTSYHALSLPPGFVGGFDGAPDGHVLFLWTLDPVTFELSGSFRSTDGGTSFAAVSGLANVGALAFDPTASSRIYASDIDGLLRVSPDDGLSFSLLPASDDPRFFGTRIGHIGVDSRGSVYLETRAGPFRTDDGGQSFRPLLNGFRASAVNDLAFDADGALLVGVLNTHVILRQAHDGAFDAIGHTAALNANGFRHATALAASPIDPNVIVVAGFGGHGLWRTGDGGRTWTEPAVPGNPRYDQARLAFASATRLYLTLPATFALPGLYRSDDAGQSFELHSDLPFGAVAVDPADADIVYLGTFNASDGLFKSTDGGQTLHDLGQPGEYSALAVDRLDPRVVYAGAKFGQVTRSLDGGQTFATASAGLNGAGVHGFAQDPRGTLFVWIRGGGLFSSRDRAATWQAVDTGEALQRSGVEVGRGTIVADPRHPGRVYLGHGGVIRIQTGDAGR